MNKFHAGNIVNEKIRMWDFSNAVEALDTILYRCVQGEVSDIHIDPKKDFILIRIRTDGIIDDFAHIAKDLHEELISRLKILSETRTDMHDVPQDGRFNLPIDDELYSIRVSFMPTFFGENAVLRLLPMKSKDHLSFAKLGFGPDQVKIIDKILKYSFGMILVAGPTGCGKTTTLHTCLKEKTRDNISAIALEDPIEYEIPRVRQIHVRSNHGVTFANVLRSVLRQDPDVIMVGEIRDNETAHVAMHTALTGHLVFSTIHTNNALETITRLRDMKVDPYMLASTLRLVISQRLVRNICKHCAQMGCATCHMTGYLGRTVISEILEFDDEIRSILTQGGTTDDIHDHILTKGWRSIDDDAKEKIEWGITTREEVTRVLG